MRTIVAVLALRCVSRKNGGEEMYVQESEGEDEDDGKLGSRVHLHFPDEKYG